MDLDKYPAPHPQVAARIVDHAAVIILADSGEVNVLNRVSTRVWELSDGSRNVQQIADVIVSEFQVTPQEARQDVQVFLQELADARMVEFREQPVASQDSANHDAY